MTPSIMVVVGVGLIGAILVVGRVLARRRAGEPTNPDELRLYACVALVALAAMFVYAEPSLRGWIPSIALAVFGGALVIYTAKGGQVGRLARVAGIGAFVLGLAGVIALSIAYLTGS